MDEGEGRRPLLGPPALTLYLKKIGRLRYVMILKKLGYVDRMIAITFTNLRRAYPETHEAFSKELEDL